jgi:signal transduction histidine kinase
MLSHKLDNINVHMDLDEENKDVVVDPLKFGEVLENLISNAADAMPDGGVIRINSERATIDENDFLRISISDTGSGIDEEELGRIFEPFFTTKEKRTGLGLAICMRILDAHNGMLNVTSKINEGTCAEIMLPL